MAYVRKTKDEWHIWANYGYGWEHELTEATRNEAKMQVRCYLENASGLRDIKIKKVRVKI